MFLFFLSVLPFYNDFAFLLSPTRYFAVFSTHPFPYQTGAFLLNILSLIFSISQFILFFLFPSLSLSINLFPFYPAFFSLVLLSFLAQIWSLYHMSHRLPPPFFFLSFPTSLFLLACCVQNLYFISMIRCGMSPC